MIGGGCFVLIAIALLVVDNSLLNRAVLFVQSLATLSIDKIDAVDHSAAYRIAPVFAYLKNINIFETHFWLGSGLDTGRAFCQRFMYILSGDDARRKEPQPCIRCAKCVGVCPMGLEPYLLAKLSAFKNWERAEREDIVSCIECGSCQFTCPAHRPLLDNIRQGKQTVMGIIRSRAAKK